MRNDFNLCETKSIRNKNPVNYKFTGFYVELEVFEPIIF